MHWIYIVECSDGTYYTGYTRNVEKRIKEHNESKKGAKYTRCRRPVVLRYAESFESRQAACRREYEIKQLPRVKKEELIKKKAYFIWSIILTFSNYSSILKLVIIIIIILVYTIIGY